MAITVTALCHHFFLFCSHIFLLSILIQHCSATESSTSCLEETSTNSSSITDGISTNNQVSLISPRRTFELGFFTPDKSSESRRYLGIWYYQSNPKIIVWVANRDNPLLPSNGSNSLVIEHGNAKLLDGQRIPHWSTNSLTHLNSTKLCLLDIGNLVLSYRKTSLKEPMYLWQSFEDPTDTFLPAMSQLTISNPFLSLNLTSWQNYDNPGKGNYTFELQPGSVNEMVIVDSGHSHYWKSTTNPSDNNVSELYGFLTDPTNTNQSARLVMNVTGQLQFWEQVNNRSWSLLWSVPKDRCSLYNVCGNFASCNSNNGILCKCLPGFKPSPQWKGGDTTGGCNPMFAYPNNRNDSLSDIFYELPSMTVSNETCTAEYAEQSCKAECLEDPNCVAYAHGSDCSVTGVETEKSEKQCLIWHYILADLQEDSLNGITLYVRTRSSDIEPNPGGCNPCGAYVVPYPLSTGSNCGDPSYFNFHCNKTIGQLNFSTSSGNFKVTSIDPSTYNFSIQVIPANTCASRFINLSVLSENDSSPFVVRNCKVFNDVPLLEVEHPFIEVEIGWKPPLEPACNVTLDCKPWPHTTCKIGHGGRRRCICASKFHWNGLKLKCTRASFPLKVVVPCIAGALVIVLACSLLIVYHVRKRRLINKQDSYEFNEDDTEGIDVPYFDWESILASTNGFADENKLGTGGFGSVYMGKLLDGQEIAVKRLSSVSVQGVEEFRTEVKLIAKLQHRNLVRLVGYCIKGSEKILVYEYMRNGSLDSCLYDEKHYVDLNWKMRYDIILGIARGLLYLHQDSRLRIIHRDLKPSNILLDEDFNPKISDFGIAKIVGGKETQASTARIVGTYGYMSPEYAYDGIFSVKSDVFSFGVVMLETISGKRNSKIFMIQHGLSLLGQAWKLWNEDRGLELMDEKLNESCSPSQVLKCIHIGLLCVQEDPSDRPTMSTVVHMLSGENASLPLANPPAFLNRKPLSDTASSSSTKDIQEFITISTVGR